MKTKNIPNMTDEQLKNEYLVYWDLIYGNNPCYGVKDMFYFRELELEIENREIHTISH